MTNANLKAKDFPFDAAVYKARIETNKAERNYSDFVKGVENDDDERLKFIKRRELYREAKRNGKVSDSMCQLNAILHGQSTSSMVLSRYANNEVRIQFQPSNLPSPPPPNYGARSSVGLTKYARMRLNQGVAYLSKNGMQRLAFITLSYSDEALPIHHAECKVQLSNFFKALKRHRPCAEYVWVAEIQPKRLKNSGVAAIHFHIACNSFVDCEWLRKTWRRITRCQKSLPNVIEVTKPAHYMAKYLGKASSIVEGETSKEVNWVGGDRYGMSHSVSKGLKPTESIRLNASYEVFNETLMSNGFFRNTNWCTDYCLSMTIPASVSLKNLTLCQA